MKEDISVLNSNANPLNWLSTKITPSLTLLRAMDVGLSTMTKWVKQLRDERQKRQKPPDNAGTNRNT
jgi:hypothetical protein